MLFGGELKRLGAQSAAEVSVHDSCVRFSGCVAIKVSQAYN